MNKEEEEERLNSSEEEEESAVSKAIVSSVKVSRKLASKTAVLKSEMLKGDGVSNMAMFAD